MPAAITPARAAAKPTPGRSAPAKVTTPLVMSRSQTVAIPEAPQSISRPSYRLCPLRLFVCQKNETRLLRPWLEHALSLVDEPKDVRVVDDNSTDKGVLATLDWAEALGVQVIRVRPPHMSAFQRKNILFTRWVHEHPASEPAFYVPLDCDEFLAARGRLHARASEYVRLEHATLPVNTTLSHQKRSVRAALQALVGRGFGTSTIRRLRNFSHVPGLFSDIREHKWCGINRKIIVFGGGKITLQHALAIPDRGYHDVVTGRNHGPTSTLCLVEFHNMPYGERQHKSIMMSNLVPATSRVKYLTEGSTDRAEYQCGQEKAAHMQPTARALNFAALVPDIVYDFDGAEEFCGLLRQQRESQRLEHEAAWRESQQLEGVAAAEQPTSPSTDEELSEDGSGDGDAEFSDEDEHPPDSTAAATCSHEDPDSTAADDEEAMASELPIGWMALSEEERAEVIMRQAEAEEESAESIVLGEDEDEGAAA